MVCGKCGNQRAKRRCANCMKVRGRAWYVAHKDQILPKKRAAYKVKPTRYKPAKYTRKMYFDRLKREYGLTPERYELMHEAQEGRCAICGERPKTQNFCVDHDHQTGRVRGLLCRRCNLGLGNLRDDPMLLRQAATYLEQARGQDDAQQS